MVDLRNLEPDDFLFRDDPRCPAFEEQGAPLESFDIPDSWEDDPWD